MAYWGQGYQPGEQTLKPQRLSSVSHLLKSHLMELFNIFTLKNQNTSLVVLAMRKENEAFLLPFVIEARRTIPQAFPLGKRGPSLNGFLYLSCLISVVGKDKKHYEDHICKIDALKTDLILKIKECFPSLTPCHQTLKAQQRIKHNQKYYKIQALPKEGTRGKLWAHLGEKNKDTKGFETTVISVTENIKENPIPCQTMGISH